MLCLIFFVLSSLAYMLMCVCVFYYYYYYKVADLCFVGKKTTFEIELVNVNYIHLFMGTKGGKRGHLSGDQILEA